MSRHERKSLLAAESVSWNHVEFAQKLAQYKLSKDYVSLKKLLVEVSESNYRMRDQWHIPRTIPISYAECSRMPAKGGKPPRISMSMMDTIEALLKFGKERGRVVCGLNFANGKDVGGGYKNGSTAQEEDLCRRIPTLYSSLHQAERDGLYPFGPPTCSSSDKPEKYSDVLYTCGLTIARAGEEEGYRILSKEEQVDVSLIAAAAPNIRFAHEVSDPVLIYRTIQTIFIAPQFVPSDKGVNTLILGAWGCGAFGGDPIQIAELFVRALVQDNLGQPYDEIHFAIPSLTTTDVNYQAFREVFQRFRLEFRDI